MSNSFRIATDLGAGSGRIIAGIFSGNNLCMTEVHRFGHDIVIRANKKCWNWELISKEINRGLCKACEFAGTKTIASVSCDSWSQDFGLLDSSGNLFYGPVSYRDERTKGMPESFSDIINTEALFHRNGSAIYPITTLCQLRAMSEREPETLEEAVKLLHIADLVHYQLCGAAKTDWTMATASQMWNIRQNQWDEELLKKLNIPAGILGKVLLKPAIIGNISPESAPHPKLAGVPVISGAGHDTATASALMLPFKNGDLMASLGTWAMLGCVTDKGIDSLQHNEGLGYIGLPYGNWGVFKSGTGLWPLQQCRKEWHNLSWREIERQTQESNMDSIIDLTDKSLFAPEKMTRAVADLCKQKPETVGDFSRIILRSLAKHIAENIENLSETTGFKFEALNVVGGGVRDGFLCDTLAQMCGLQIKKGCAEASAAGNLLLQAMTAGDIININEINILENR
jgi:sugar (pentulose or hexulose) kinase